jgi:hypothetical protein
MPTPQRRAAVVELTNPPVTADASEPRTPTAEIASRPGKRNSLRCAASKLDIYAPSIGGYASQPRPLKRDMRKSDQSVLKRSGAVEIMNIDSLIIFYCAVFGHGRQVSDWQSDHTRVVAISGAHCAPFRCAISPPEAARSRPSFWRAQARWRVFDKHRALATGQAIRRMGGLGSGTVRMFEMWRPAAHWAPCRCGISPPTVRLRRCPRSIDARHRYGHVCGDWTPMAHLRGGAVTGEFYPAPVETASDHSELAGKLLIFHGGNFASFSECALIS